MLEYAICIAIGYLLGNFQTSVLISRMVYKDDIRHHGSGNAGTTNMLRVFGMKSGSVTFVGDLIKGVLSVFIGRWIGGEIGGYLCGLGTVLGHDYPAFFGFRGGKGVASTLGILWVISPLHAAIITVVTFGVIFATKMVSLGSLVGMAIFFALSIAFHWGEVVRLIFVGLLLVLIVIRHRENIERIFKGQESKLFQTSKSKKHDQEG
ncbi:MAG: glycerol-3-phosphate 1-O-acyltransferase PlsY [Bacillota bacterium]